MMQRLVSGTWRRLVGFFLAGLFAILPLIITIAVIIWVAEFIRGFIGPESVIGSSLRSVGGTLAPAANTTIAYIIGCGLVLVVIFALGVFVQAGLRRFLGSMMDAVMRRIPLAGSVYGAATQIVGLLEKKDDSELSGMGVVFCMFGQQNGTGILALLPTAERFPINGCDYHIVYIPTSPIPMTGGLLFVPVDQVQRVDMNVEALMSIYLSMGITGPQFLGENSQGTPAEPAV